MAKRKELFKKIIGVCFIVAILMFFIPTPYMIMSPGVASDLSPIITVEGGYKSQSTGDFMLTAVSAQRAKVWDYLLFSVRKPYGSEMEPLEQHLPKGMNMREYMNIMQIYMEDSKNKAKTVAFEKAGYEVEVVNNGVIINEVLDNGSAKGKLEQGDRILAVNGKEVEKGQDAIDYIRENEIGEEIRITVLRDGETLDYNMETVQMNEEEQQASIGVMIYTDFFYDFPMDVVFHTERIGGSSAGGMFTLEIYNQLVEEDITGGRRIAGTGTINLEGEIGRIDGVEQKIITSEINNAVLFFVPVDNYEAAAATARTIEVVAIETIDDAINYLQD